MKHVVIWSGESLGCLAIIGIALLFVIISSMLPMLIVLAIFAGLGYLLVRACTDIPGNRARWVAAFAAAYLVIGSFTAVVAQDDIAKSRTRGLWPFSSTDTFGVFVDQAKIVLLWPYVLIRDELREKT